MSSPRQWIRSRLWRLLPPRPAYGVPRPTLAAPPLTLAAQEIDTRGVTVPVPTFDRKSRKGE